MALLNLGGWSTQSRFETARVSPSATVAVASGGKNANYIYASSSTGNVDVGKHGPDGSPQPVALNIANIYAGFWCYTGTAATTTIARMLTSGLSQKLEVNINSSAQIEIEDATAGVIGTVSTAVSASTWYFIRVSGGTGSSGVSWELTVIDTAGATVGTVSGSAANTGTSNYDRLRFALDATIGNRIGGFYIDDSAFLNSGGLVYFDTLTVNTAGTPSFTAWTGTDEDVDDIPHDSSTTEISTSTQNNEESVVMAAANITGSDTVYAVKGIAFAKDDSFLTNDMNVFLYDGSYTDHTTAFTPATSYADVNSPVSILSETQPGGGAWTGSSVSGIEIGVRNEQVESRQMNATQIVGTAVYSVSGGSIVPIINHYLLTG